MNIEISDFSLTPETGREDENIGVFQQAASEWQGLIREDWSGGSR